MKKRIFRTKLPLNKETIVNITQEDMKRFRAGADVTDIGNSCWTTACCYTRNVKNCEEPVGYMKGNPPVDKLP